MFTRYAHAAKAVPEEAEDSNVVHLHQPVVAPPATELDPAVTEMLGRWMALGETQRRTFEALCQEIDGTSSSVEDAAIELSDRFRRLSGAARAQRDRVNQIIGMSETIETEESSIGFDEVTNLLETTLASVVDKILMMSKQAMTMVYALEDATTHIEAVDNCIARIDQLNRQTKMLSLNATIEAVRAGAAGQAFGVVANEVKELSKSTSEVASEIKREIGAIIGGLREGHAVLREVATLDMTENIMIKERVDGLIRGLARRRDQVDATMREAASSADEISRDIAGIITGIQFQDRSKQRLDHVADTLRVLGAAAARHVADTRVAVPSVPEAELDRQWVDQLLSGFSLSDVRQRFVQQLLRDEGEALVVIDAGPTQEAGTIDLF